MTISQYKLADALRHEADELLEDMLQDVEAYTCDAMASGQPTEDTLTVDAFAMRVAVLQAKRELLLDMARDLEHDRLFEQGLDRLAGSEEEEQG